jgi:hypothetical protein
MKYWHCKSCSHPNPIPEGKRKSKKKQRCIGCHRERGAPAKNLSFVAGEDSNREPGSYRRYE